MVRRYRRKESKKEASSEMKRVQDDLTSLKKTLESYLEKKKVEPTFIIYLKCLKICSFF